jgi:TRAP-type C4-dicarboxylate transport system permease small subunit
VLQTLGTADAREGVMETTQGRPAGEPGLLKRIDDNWAHFEAWLAIGMLLVMIVVAFAQAFLRNMTQRGFQWANAGLVWLDWADFILTKGTLWVAFLGASLAVHADKHVAIDIIHRLIGPKTRMALRSAVGFVGCVISAFLVRAFWNAVVVNGREVPMEFDVITDTGSVHLCDATPAQLEASGYESSFYCYVRAILNMFGVHMATPGAAFQLIVPVSFSIMALRFLGIGIRDALRVARGDVEDDPSTHGLTGTAHDVADDLDQQGNP